MIERGEVQKEGQKHLAESLGVSPLQLSHAKAHRRPLPDYACVRLAQLLELEPIEVIAASALATAKNPERREVWRPFVERIAASVATVLFVSSFVTSSDANADTARVCGNSNSCNTNYTKFSAMLRRLFRSAAAALLPSGCPVAQGTG